LQIGGLMLYESVTHTVIIFEQYRQNTLITEKYHQLLYNKIVIRIRLLRESV
jgi:hypothetical protein